MFYHLPDPVVANRDLAELAWQQNIQIEVNPTSVQPKGPLADRPAGFLAEIFG